MFKKLFGPIGRKKKINITVNRRTEEIVNDLLINNQYECSLADVMFIFALSGARGFTNGKIKEMVLNGSRAE